MALLSGVTLAGLLTLGGLFSVDGNGKVKEEVREVAEFTGVDVGGSVQAEIRIGKERKVTVVTDENLLPLVKTTVKDGVLEVATSKSVSPTRGIRLIVTAPSIDSISASGGTKVNAEVARTAKFKLDASGGAELDIRGIDTDVLTLDMSGGVDAKVAGKAKTAKVELSGGVALAATSLQISDATVDASGGVTAQLAVSNAVKGDVSGGATVKVKGKPTMEIDAGRGASVTSKD